MEKQPEPGEDGYLEALRQRTEDWQRHWTMSGRLLAEYACPECGATNYKPQPRESDVSQEKPFWDSLTTCVWCGQMAMVRVDTDGHAVVTR